MSKSTRRFWVRWEWMSSTLWMFVATLVILENQFSQFRIRIIFYFLPTSSKVQAIRLFSSETVELNIEHLFVRLFKIIFVFSLSENDPPFVIFRWTSNLALFPLLFRLFPISIFPADQPDNPKKLRHRNREILRNR